MAAIEAAEMQRRAHAAGDKRAGSVQRWQVVKVDRQIVAIAKINGVSVIYSDDEGLKRLAEAAGIRCKGIADLPLPPSTEQPGLFDDTGSPSPGSQHPSHPSGDDESGGA